MFNNPIKDKVVVGMGTCGISSGANIIFDILKNEKLTPGSPG